MTIKALIEKRGEAYTAIKTLRDAADGRDFTTEEQAKWDAANTDFDSATSQIEREEKHERFAKINGDSAEQIGREDHTARKTGGADAITEETRNLAFAGWCRGNHARKSEVEAQRQIGMDPKQDVNFSLFRNAPKSKADIKAKAEARAQGVATGAAGDYTVPVGFVAQLEQALLSFGGMREASFVIRTDTGNDLHWPTVNDTGNVGVLLAENTEETTETDLVFSELVLNAYKYSSDLVRVSTELMQDSAFDVAGYLATALGERIARILNQHFTTGTGSGQPNGAVTASAAGKTAASATAITADELIDLFHSVDPSYRANASWMFEDATLQVIRKLKSADSQYIWQPGFQADMPNLMLGRPYIVNQDMGTIATTVKSVLFGDLGKYIIRDVRELRLRHMVEKYATFDQDGFLAFSRHDGDELDAGTNPIKHLVQA